MRVILLEISLLLVYPGCGVAQPNGNESTLIEPETGARYPADVTFVRDGTQYRLSATGVAVRTKFWFKIYSIAHYLEDGPAGTQAEVLASIMSDDTAKQVILEFARDLRADQVRDGFVESFTQRAGAEESRKTKAALRQFLRSIRKDVIEHDRFVVRWLPGGRLISMYNGKVVSEISDRAFARVFWSAWFGEAPIVDRHRLIALRLLRPGASDGRGHLQGPGQALNCHREGSERRAPVDRHGASLAFSMTSAIEGRHVPTPQEPLNHVGFHNRFNSEFANERASG